MVVQRITISVDDDLALTFDALIRDRGYQSRSEAVRDIVRDAIERWREETGSGDHCVANLSYVYDRRVRALAQRLSDMQHSHHDLVAATTLVRLDHHHSFESVILKGPTATVKAFADQVRAERGVRFGNLNLLAVKPGDHHTPISDHHHHLGQPHLSPIGR